MVGAPSLPMRPQHLAALVAPLAGSEAAAIAVRASGPWTGGDRLVVGQTERPVLLCPSPLALREALDRHAVADTAARPILLVEFDESALGWDVRARLAKRRLLTLEPWDVVRDLFKAQRVDARLVRDGWMAGLLLDAVPPDGYPPVAGEVLGADTAWGHALNRLLGLTTQRPDADGLLLASVHLGFAAAYMALPDGARASVRAELSRVGGPLLAALAQTIEVGMGERLLAVGLACDVLYPETERASADLNRAAVRLESMLGGHPLPAEVARAWATASRRVLGRLEAHDRDGILADAEHLLGEVRATAFLGLSTVLPGGYRRRVERLGEAIRSALDGQPAEDAEAAFLALQAHDLAAAPEDRLRSERLHMALRLVRYLASSGAKRPRTLGDAIQAYVAEGSFVDWARALLVGGDQNAGLASALDALSERVRERRERGNERFAQRLASWNERPDLEADVLPIERVLDAIVAPLAADRPVLLLVLDGMGLANFRQLAPQLRERGWDEVAPQVSVGRPVALAVSPSITRLSRMSLLSGTLQGGVARDERRAFAAASVLAKASDGQAPVLFHKGGLQEGPTAALAPDVRAALADDRQRVVGIVLNVLDDSLTNSDQRLPLWRVDRIRLLEAILQEARACGRTLVLASDHGHVLELDGEALPGGKNERWRRHSTPLHSAEVALAGPRIRAVTDEDRIVVPWSERVRYVRKKAGYHGGATPQEMVVPVAVFAPAGAAAPGVPLQEKAPPWWSPETTPRSASPPPPPSRGKAKSSAAGLPDLFAEPAETDKPKDWSSLVVRSATYRAQEALSGRSAPESDVAERALRLLEREGGRSERVDLRQALSLDEEALTDFLQKFERVMNVDGHPTANYDASSETLLLDLSEASAQFGVSRP